MNSIPLISNVPGVNFSMNRGNASPEIQMRQEINTSLVALKKEAGTLEGLINEASQILDEVNNRIATLENDTVKKNDVVNVVQSGNMNPVTSNAVNASELSMRNGSRMVTRCSKVAGDYAQHWAKLFSFGISRHYDSGVCFFEIVGHSINKGSKISGYIGGYTQSVSDPYIWNSSNTLNNASLYYNKEVQSDENVLINVYVPTFTDNYMWWELKLNSNKDLIIYNSPDLITDVSNLTAFQR